jgi:hypothetical protein
MQNEIDFKYFRFGIFVFVNDAYVFSLTNIFVFANEINIPHYDPCWAEI